MGRVFHLLFNRGVVRKPDVSSKLASRPGPLVPPNLPLEWLYDRCNEIAARQWWWETGHRPAYTGINAWRKRTDQNCFNLSHETVKS